MSSDTPSLHPGRMAWLPEPLLMDRSGAPFAHTAETGFVGHREESPHLASLMYEYFHRPSHDRFWRFLYVVLLTGTLAAGLFSLANRTDELSLLFNTTYLDDPGNCPYPGPHPDPGGSSTPSHHHPHTPHAPLTLTSLASLAATSSSTAASLATQLDPWTLGRMLKGASLLLCSAGAASFLLAVGFDALLRHSPRLAVLVAICVQIAAPVAGGIMLLQSGSLALAYSCLAIAAVLGLACYVNSEALELVARVLGVSAGALSTNSGLLMLTASLNLALLLSLLLLAVCALAASWEGQTLPNPVRVPEAGIHCISPTGEMVQCCMWQYDTFPLVFLPAAAAMGLWTVALAAQMKAFIISGTIGQWYFSPVGAPGSVRRATGHALGPSLGSLALASVLLTAATYVRLLFGRYSKQRRSRGCVPALCGCCVMCLADLLHMMTNFTTVYMSMAGTSFLQSGREVVELLKRNSMDVMNVWWLPPLVLHLPNLFVSCVLGYATYAASSVMWRDLAEAQPEHAGAITWAAMVLGVLCSLVCSLLLSFFTSLLLHIVDAVFVCYAVDRDSCTCSQPDVHAVYCRLPACGGPPPGTALLDSTHPLPHPLLLVPSDSYPSYQHHPLRNHHMRATGPLNGGINGLIGEYCLTGHSPPSPLGTPPGANGHQHTLQGSWYAQAQAQAQAQMYGAGAGLMGYGVGNGQAGQPGGRASYSGVTQQQQQDGGGGAGGHGAGQQGLGSMPGPGPGSAAYAPPGSLYHQPVLPGAGYGGTGTLAVPQYQPYMLWQAGPSGHSGGGGDGVGFGDASAAGPSNGMLYGSSTTLLDNPYCSYHTGHSPAPLPLGLMPLGPSPLAYTPSFQMPGNLAGEVQATHVPPDEGSLSGAATAGVTAHGTGAGAAAGAGEGAEVGAGGGGVAGPSGTPPAAVG